MAHDLALDLTIIGAGAVAAATALAAAHYRVPFVQWMPATQQPNSAKSGGRRYALSRSSVDFLQTMGVEFPTLPVEQFILHAGKRPLVLQEKNKPLCYMAAEEHLTQALENALQKINARRFSYQEMRYEKSDADAVQICIDGTVQRSALLAVADGARSPLATQIGIFSSVTDFHQQAVVADVLAPQLPANSASQWFADNDIVALLPTGEGVFSLVWSTTAAESTLTPAELTTALCRRTGLTDIRITSAIRTFPLAAVRRSARVAPRIALLGDAAAVVHPLAGQGLNLGLADAKTLLQCVHRRIERNLSLGLAAYSRARTQRSNQLQQLTQFLLPQQRRVACLLTAARLPLMRQLAIAGANY
ncbi:MAG: FAD-dependent monooxygenase [Proteobacteria bacterium]|nr:FAD-dependent monooxygenase [Pseudomonadota bacterium]